MRKALKNIPKPDEEKLAVFYGQDKKQKPKETKKEPEMPTVDKMDTVVKETTVDATATVVNEELLRDKLRSVLPPCQQAVYLTLFKQSLALGQDATGWIGYSELAKDSKVSRKTTQRAITAIIKNHLIKKVDFINTAEQKGSKYQVFLPAGIEVPTVDEKATVDKMDTVDKEATVDK